MTDKSLQEKASRPADKDNAEAMHVADGSKDIGATDTTAKEGKRKADKDNSEAIHTADTSLEMGEKETKAKEGKRPADKDNADGMHTATDTSMGMKVESIDDTTEAKLVNEQETPDVKLSEDIKSLLESLDLPPEFKTKALDMFEGAIALRVADIRKEMFSVNETKMEEYKKSLSEKVEETTDTYVAEAVATWLSENDMQVKSSVKLQLAESFMANLANLLESHYITIPDGKEDILETVLAKADGLQIKLDEQIKLNESLKESNQKIEKSLVVESIVKSLTDTQAERVRTLAEGLQFDVKDAFETKLSTIVESITKTADKASTALLEDAMGEVVIKEDAPVEKSKVHPFVQRISADLKALAK